MENFWKTLKTISAYTENTDWKVYNLPKKYPSPDTVPLINVFSKTAIVKSTSNTIRTALKHLNWVDFHIAKKPDSLRNFPR